MGARGLRTQGGAHSASAAGQQRAQQACRRRRCHAHSRRSVEREQRRRRQVDDAVADSFKVVNDPASARRRYVTGRVSASAHACPVGKRAACAPHGTCAQLRLERLAVHRPRKVGEHAAVFCHGTGGCQAGCRRQRATSLLRSEQSARARRDATGGARSSLAPSAAPLCTPRRWHTRPFCTSASSRHAVSSALAVAPGPHHSNKALHARTRTCLFKCQRPRAPCTYTPQLVACVCAADVGSQHSDICGCSSGDACTEARCLRPRRVRTRVERGTRVRAGCCFTHAPCAHAQLKPAHHCVGMQGGARRPALRTPARAPSAAAATSRPTERRSLRNEDGRRLDMHRAVICWPAQRVHAPSC